MSKFLFWVFPFFYVANLFADDLNGAPSNLIHNVVPDATINRMNIHFEMPSPSSLEPTTLMPTPPPPRWIAFTSLGDGRYRRDTLLINSTTGKHYLDFSHVYPSSTATANYTMEVTMLAIYSPDKEPKRIINVPVEANGTASVEPWSAFIGITGPITLEPQWPQARPEDEVLLALSYRYPSGLSGTLDGSIRMEFDPATFAYVDVLNIGAAPSSHTISSDGGTISWPYGGLSTAAEERTFFVKLRVKNISVMAPPAYKPITVSLINNQQSFYSFRNLLGTPTIGDVKGGQVTYGQSQLYTSEVSVGSYTKELAIVSSLDPNGIDLVPTCLEKRRLAQPLFVRTYFTNTGTAPANEVEVATYLEADHFQFSRSAPQYSPSNKVTLTSTGVPNIRYNDALKGVDRVVLMSAENIKDAQEKSGGTNFREDIITVIPNIGGFVSYTTQTKANLNKIDSIRIKADIIMDRNTLVKERAIPVCRSCAPKVRWQHGIKVIYHSKGSQALQSGVGTHYVLRMPLDRPDSRYLPDNYLKALPQWWLQWEGGISRLKFNSPAGGMSATYIDLTPLQLLFAPRFANSQRRPIGFFVGYTAAYRATAVPRSRGSRWEHNFECSIETLNVLGRPGFTVGLGLAYRVVDANGLFDGYGNYTYPFAFVRHSLAHHLQYH